MAQGEPAYRDQQWLRRSADLHVAAGQLRQVGNAAGMALVLEELWVVAVNPSGVLHFTAGTGDEEHGTYGTLVPR